MLKVRHKETVSMLTRDRVRCPLSTSTGSVCHFAEGLDADIYRPDAEGDFGGATDAAALWESDRITLTLALQRLAVACCSHLFRMHDRSRYV